MLDELLDRLGVGVGVLRHDGISGESRVFRFLTFDDSPRNADDRCAGRHFLDDHRVGADARAIADGETAQDLRSRAHHDAGAESRMPFGVAVERGAAKRHALIDRAAIADLCGLANYDAHAVIDKHAGAYLRAGMDLDPGQPAPEVRREAPEPAQVLQPEPARELVDVDR